uniref:Protein kinase domain-containing protein n=1 Tax=Lactuca sativa TaxID=4236 RepID=A0A9R1UK98_LACSA|nr:hypothetical protein LSAT_V11C900465230 [Lactuca sativa]
MLTGVEEVSAMQTAPVGTPEGDGLIAVIIHEGEDLEGKHHTHPSVCVLFHGEEKRTKMLSDFIDCAIQACIRVSFFPTASVKSPLGIDRHLLSNNTPTNTTEDGFNFSAYRSSIFFPTLFYNHFRPRHRLLPPFVSNLISYSARHYAFFSFPPYRSSQTIAHLRCSYHFDVQFRAGTTLLSVMLTDFGVAMQFDESTRLNSMCGTLEYMTPEIVQGRGHDKAADWWSVGILMYEMLSGKPLFRGGNRQKIQEKIVKDKIKLPRFLSSEAHSLFKGVML